MVKRLLPLLLPLSACSTHNSLTAPASAYCDTQTPTTIVDTTYQVSGPWTFIIIRSHPGIAITWHPCRDDS